MFPFFRKPDYAPDLHDPGVIQPNPESEHPVDLVALLRRESVEVHRHRLSVALDENLQVALGGLDHPPPRLEALDLFAGIRLLSPQGLHFLLVTDLVKAAIEVEVQETVDLHLDVLKRFGPVGK